MIDDPVTTAFFDEADELLGGIFRSTHTLKGNLYIEVAVDGRGTTVRITLPQIHTARAGVAKPGARESK
jgi:hypothetical protein